MGLQGETDCRVWRIRLVFPRGVHETSANAHAVIRHSDSDQISTLKELSADVSSPPGMILCVREQFTGSILEEAINIVLRVGTRQRATGYFRRDLVHITTRKIQGLNRYKPVGSGTSRKLLGNFYSEVQQKVDPLEITQSLARFDSAEEEAFPLLLPPVAPRQHGDDGGRGEKLYSGNINFDGGSPVSGIQ